MRSCVLPELEKKAETKKKKKCRRFSDVGCFYLPIFFPVIRHSEHRCAEKVLRFKPEQKKKIVCGCWCGQCYLKASVTNFFSAHCLFVLLINCFSKILECAFIFPSDRSHFGFIRCTFWCVCFFCVCLNFH